jgi:hypothetical protein
MSRRIIPGTFWVGSLASALLLLLAGTMRASGPPHHLPDVQGVWDGFFLAADGATGRVRSDITEQHFRRLAGDGVLLDLQGGDLAYRFRATLARPDFLTGTGVTPTGRLVFQAELGPFAGLGGDAVMAPEYHFVPARGGAGRISALLLHPFPAVDAPDIAGSYEGPFVSLPDPITGAPADPTFRGIGRMPIAPRNARGSFAGRVNLFLDSEPDPLISWPFLATTSDDGRVIWISQGVTGRIIYEGVVVPAPDQTVARLDGVFRLLFNDGRSLFNAYNCPIAAR